MVRGTDNGRRENQKSWLWHHCRRKSYYWIYSDHPRKLVTLNPKLKSTGAGRYRLLSRWWDAYPQAAWPERLLSEKSGRCGDCSRLKERGALPMIDRGDIRQAVSRCSNIWSTAGRWCRWFSMGWQPDCKIQRSGRNGQRDWCMGKSPRLSPLWLSASSSACHELLIITVITPLPTKPSATKMPENWKAGERGSAAYGCVSVMLLRSMQNTRRVSWC